MITIGPVGHADHAALWQILEPVIRAGETYAQGRDLDREAALGWWLAPPHRAFVARDADGIIIGTYYLQPNQAGGGAHVANAGFMVRAGARGVGRAMGEHALITARALGFTAMQFNFVVSTNTRAIALWQSLGFAEVGRIPAAFDHPGLGLVDALVMHRAL